MCRLFLIYRDTRLPRTQPAGVRIWLWWDEHGNFTEEEICMRLVSRSHHRTGLIAALVAAAFTFGCAKKPVAQTPAAPAPLRCGASHSDVAGQPYLHQQGRILDLELEFHRRDRTLHRAGSRAVTAQGSTKVSPADSTTYTITASGPGAPLPPPQPSP